MAWLKYLIENPRITTINRNQFAIMIDDMQAQYPKISFPIIPSVAEISSKRKKEWDESSM